MNDMIVCNSDKAHHMCYERRSLCCRVYDDISKVLLYDMARLTWG